MTPETPKARKPRKPPAPTESERVLRIWLTVTSINDDDGAALWRTRLIELLQDIEHYDPPRWADTECTKALVETSRAVWVLLDRVCDVCYVARREGGWDRVEFSDFNIELERQAKGMVLAHVRYSQKWIATVSAAARDPEKRQTAEKELLQSHDILSERIHALRWTFKIRSVHDQDAESNDDTNDSTTIADVTPNLPHSSTIKRDSFPPSLQQSPSSPPSPAFSAPRSPRVRDTGSTSREQATYVNPLAAAVKATYARARQQDDASLWLQRGQRE